MKNIITTLIITLSLMASMSWAGLDPQDAQVLEDDSPCLESSGALKYGNEDCSQNRAILAQEGQILGNTDDIADIQNQLLGLLGFPLVEDANGLFVGVLIDSDLGSNSQILTNEFSPPRIIVWDSGISGGQNFINPGTGAIIAYVDKCVNPTFIRMVSATDQGVAAMGGIMFISRDRFFTFDPDSPTVSVAAAGQVLKVGGTCTAVSGTPQLRDMHPVDHNFGLHPWTFPLKIRQ